jgi:hypothetical protein
MRPLVFSLGVVMVADLADYADFMPVAIPFIPYFGLSLLLAANRKR